MPNAHFTARSRIETPLPQEQVAGIVAGERPCGTFTSVADETESVRKAWCPGVEALALGKAGNLHRPLAAALDRFGDRW